MKEADLERTLYCSRNVPVAIFLIYIYGTGVTQTKDGKSAGIEKFEFCKGEVTVGTIEKISAQLTTVLACVVLTSKVAMDYETSCHEYVRILYFRAPEQQQHKQYHSLYRLEKLLIFCSHFLSLCKLFLMQKRMIFKTVLKVIYICHLQSVPAVFFDTPGRPSADQGFQFSQKLRGGVSIKLSIGNSSYVVGDPFVCAAALQVGPWHVSSILDFQASDAIISSHAKAGTCIFLTSIHLLISRQNLNICDHNSGTPC